MKEKSKGSEYGRVRTDACDCRRYRLGVYDQAGLAGSIKGVFADAGGLLEHASKGEKPAFDIQSSIDKLKGLYEKYNRGDGYMQAGDQNTNRGILMDTWLDATDRNDTDIAKLTPELGAKQWIYYHAKGRSIRIPSARSPWDLLEHGGFIECAADRGF